MGGNEIWQGSTNKKSPPLVKGQLPNTYSIVKELYININKKKFKSQN